MKPTRSIFLCFILLTLPLTSAFAQSGKFSGRVTDDDSGIALPGVNVVIDGTTQGAVTDVEGYYTILNVSPGTYSLRASFVGYTTQLVEGLRVSVGLTTEQNFTLSEEAIGMEEMVVTAERPVVQRDISANVANFNSAEIENLPVTDLDEVIGLEAGVEPGLSIRGGDLSEVGFVVDGFNMRDGRENDPFTTISYTSIEEVSVQTGGFNAEYGNVRSGLINVSTKEGARDRYSADVIFRYAPPQRRYFGELPNDPDGYWMRPFVDDPDIPNDRDPAFVGTASAESAWDVYDQQQYPQFRGWNAVRAELMNDGNPDNDLSVEQLSQLFDWRHRKALDVEDPDFDIDASIGGPVPGISRALGDLRFFASYRQTQNAFLIPTQRSYYYDQTARLKLTSNVAQGVKLNLNAMFSGQHGMQPSGTGFPNMWTGEDPRYPWQQQGQSQFLDGGAGGDDVFAWHTDNKSDTYRNLLGAEITHTLNANTFYEVRLQRMYSDYNVNGSRFRDTETCAITIGSLCVDEAPDGFYPPNISSLSGMNMGGHWNKARDSSEVSVYTGAFDITSQVNRFMQVKGGVEYNYSDYNVNHRQVDMFFTNNPAPIYIWNRTPHQGAAYLQTKLEFQGMVANLGVRADYWHPGGEWYVYDNFDIAFSPTFGIDSLDVTLDQEPTKRQLTVSPRLGISFPITETSKLFFNYGHFRQMLNPNNLFRVRYIVTSAIDQIGEPDNPLPRTIAYELGYEQSLFDQYLVRVSGYYRASDRQARAVRYTSLDGRSDYSVTEPLNYGDIRGVELTLRKNRGRVLRGFLNFTYMSRKAGNFGFGQIFENRSDQRAYEEVSRDHYQEKPVPEPYARANVELISPRDFGPAVAGGNPLGDWRVSLLGEWRDGIAFTYTGENLLVGVENNMHWKDYWNLDLRLSKNFSFGPFDRAQFFVDINNVLNIKRLSRNNAWQGEFDYDRYIQSLHLQEGIFEDYDDPYAYVYGDDKPGDYRKDGVAFHPIEVVGNVGVVTDPSQRPLYYERDTGRYMQYVNGSFQAADQGLVKQVLDDRAYIDMPNLEFLRFLNRRQVFFGLRVSF